ncbi:hypothetical protein ACWGRK_18535 [Saccharomonospora azurea]
MSWNSGSCRGGGRALWTGQETTPATTENDQESADTKSSSDESGEQ